MSDQDGAVSTQELKSIQLDEKESDLRCTGIVKHFPGVVALDKLNFYGKMGEVHTILGENAAGKSTFIKILGGAVRPDAGEIEFSGKFLLITSPGQARSLGIGVAYQELSLIPDLTVAQNIWLHLARPNKLAMLSDGDLRSRTLELFNRLEALPIDPNKRVRNLSYAQRQVVEICKCLASDPRIVIFDEATSTLPEAETRWALGLCRKLAQEKRIVLFITHRLDEGREIADRVTVWRRGRDVLTGPMQEFSDNQIVEAMLGRKPQLLYPPAQSKPKDQVVLSVRNLNVGHRLQEINFDLKEGEILGVGGLQGQGQSTLLLTLFGMLPYSGKVLVRDKPVHIHSPRAAFRAGIGLALVPEDRRVQGLLLTKSISDNIALPVLSKITRWGLLSDDAEQKLVERAIKQLKITAKSPEQPVTTLSGGNQQKVVVAKLLQVGCKILLFLDLTRGIDVGTKAEIFGLARELTATGHSIIMYSSENQELTHMCDRIMVLSDGRVAAILKDNELTEEAIMQAAFAIRNNGNESDI
jgi:ribose transport system ATP-binding protein